MGIQTTERWISDDAKRQYETLLSGASEMAAAMRAEAAKGEIRPRDLEEQILHRTKPLLDAAISLRTGFVALEHVWCGDLPDSLQVAVCDYARTPA